MLRKAILASMLCHTILNLSLLVAVFCFYVLSNVHGYDNAKTAAKIMKRFKATTGSDINSDASAMRARPEKKKYNFVATTTNTDVDDRGTNALVKRRHEEPHKALMNLATGIRDEVVDIFDAVVYAESHEERFENIVDIAIRHRGVLGTLALGMALKTAMSPEVSRQSGQAARAKFRSAEVAKWGSRMTN